MNFFCSCLAINLNYFAPKEMKEHISESRFTLSLCSPIDFYTGDTTESGCQSVSQSVFFRAPTAPLNSHYCCSLITVLLGKNAFWAARELFSVILQTATGKKNWKQGWATWLQIHTETSRFTYTEKWLHSEGDILYPTVKLMNCEIFAYS